MLTRAKLGLSEGDFALLSVGDLNENKNHGVLIEALAMLPSNYRLLIAGDGPLRGSLEEQVRRLGLDGRVTLLGFRKDVAALLNACDIFCLPSKREGLPVSLIEAMACGTSCLASSARGCADVLGPLADNAIVEDTASEWADAITRMAAAPQSVSTLRGQARQFDAQAVIKRVKRIYV